MKTFKYITIRAGDYNIDWIKEKHTDIDGEHYKEYTEIASDAQFSREGFLRSHPVAYRSREAREF